MKRFLFLPALLATVLLLCNGCASLDIKPEGDVNRVLTGTVNYNADEPLPPGATLTVRLLDPSDLSAPPMVVGEQTLKDPGASPVAFRIEYTASDTLLQHGLNIEARIAIGGRLQFYNVNSYAVTLNHATDSQQVWINPAGK
jgi:putative lipoprotein